MSPSVSQKETMLVFFLFLYFSMVQQCVITIITLVIIPDCLDHHAEEEGEGEGEIWAALFYLRALVSYPPQTWSPFAYFWAYQIHQRLKLSYEKCKRVLSSDQFYILQDSSASFQRIVILINIMRVAWWKRNEKRKRNREKYTWWSMVEITKVCFWMYISNNHWEIESRYRPILSQQFNFLWEFLHVFIEHVYTWYLQI